MLIETLEVGPFASNCYIVGDKTSKAGMIIDPGAEARRIEKRIKDLKLEVKSIVLTHGHMDHFGAAREVKQATGAQLAVHADDAESLRVSYVDASLPFSRVVPPEADRLLKGGDSFDIGSHHFLVIHTPGHTPGGICLFGEGVVFCGDTLFNFGIGRTDLGDGSYSQLMNSIVTKLMILPDETVVYPGHGPQTTIGTERRQNPFLRR
ncbi:MAG: MBL fold metallo-hydrolase [Chloroflexi bacterium]|nr:MBL fold metallo-hydrolase [Chloroflexota bacterium]